MKRIAIVEDNPDNMMLVRALLEDDYELTEFIDGAAALEGLPRAEPDLVLLDISLPGIDGTQVLAKLRDSPLKEVPVIALTAHAMDGDRERFLEQGFDDYLSKPIVDDEILFAKIQNLLER